MTSRLLFVCLGNICRSPMAEGLARHHAELVGKRLSLDSAGTSDWHIGHPPDRRAQATAAKNGVSLAAQRARQVRAEDFATFELIIAMDRSNLGKLQALQPDDARARLRLMLPDADVPDPYHTGDFDGVWQMLDAAIEGLLRDL